MSDYLFMTAEEVPPLEEWDLVRWIMRREAESCIDKIIAALDSGEQPLGEEDVWLKLTFRPAMFRELVPDLVSRPVQFSYQSGGVALSLSSP